MRNLKYVIQEDSMLLSYFGKRCRITIPKKLSKDEVLQLVISNINEIFGLKQELSKSLALFKIGEQIFCLPKEAETSLKRFFPAIRLLSEEEESLLRQNLQFLGNLKGTFYLKTDGKQMIHQLEEGISIYHVLDQADTIFKLPTINRFLDINILKNIYFENLIDSFDIINRQGTCHLEISTNEKEIFSFEDTNMEDLVFKSVKKIMESKLSYRYIGIGRNRSECLEDYLMKHGASSTPIFCQDSLSKFLGLVLAKKENL